MLGIPVGCDVMNEGVKLGWFWNDMVEAGDELLAARVGIKLLNPVWVGISGCKRPWFAGTGAYGPRGPLYNC
jgi:hypothetical protein